VRCGVAAPGLLPREGARARALAKLDPLITAATAPDMRQGLEMMRRRIQEEAAAAQSPPQAGRGAVTHVEIRRLEVGDQVTIQVTGRANGPLWGDFLYTLDSDIGTAAVHAGLLRVGETTPIKIWVVPSPNSFGEASRNGVQSRKWGAFRAAFMMQAARGAAIGAPVIVPPRFPRAVERLGLNESMTITVTGGDEGFVWGTDNYTGDSPVEVAAVHAGVLQVGERGEVAMTRVAAPESYHGSSRHGVVSQSWGRYPTAYVIERSPRADP